MLFKWGRFWQIINLHSKQVLAITYTKCFFYVCKKTMTFRELLLLSKRLPIFRCVTPDSGNFIKYTISNSGHVHARNALLSGHGPYQLLNAEKINQVDEPRQPKSPETGAANFRVILIYISI